MDDAQPSTTDPAPTTAGDDAADVAAQEAGPPRQSWQRIIVQIAGFGVGIGLLAWCLTNAWRDESGLTPVDHFRAAEWWLIGLLLLCTAVSLTANAATFHIGFRPFGDVGFWNMQRLNVLCNALNYLPLRPGTILRIAYHLRVDRLGLFIVGAVFAAAALLMLLTSAAFGVASLLRDDIDLLWITIAATILVSGGGFLLVVTRLPVVDRFGRGTDQLLRNHQLLWPLLALRILDLAAYTGRIAAAMMIVGIEIESGGYLVMLGVAALLFGLFPMRLGFREAGLAMIAAHFGRPEVSGAAWGQLALIESAGEALLYIPLGACLGPWLRRKWQRRDAATG